MKRPYECRCFLINKKLLELDVKQSGEPARLTIDLNEVEAYRECRSENDEDISQNECLVNMKSNDSYIIDVSYNEFNKLMQ